MIILNVWNTLLLNVGLDILSIVIVLIIFFNSRGEGESYDIRLLRRISILVMLTLISDLVMWLVNGKSGELMRIIGNVDNATYFILQLLVAVGWLRYATFRIYRRKLRRKGEMICIVIPFIVMGIASITSPFTGFVFYLDQDNWYHRGVLSAWFSIIVLVYLISASFMALHQYKKETLLERRKELMSISFFSVIPFAGGATQTLLYGASLVWPCVAIAMLMIFIGKEKQEISQDALTGLNNRGRLDRFLQTDVDLEPGQSLILVMADLNHFKEINDTYGHNVGDDALLHAATLLKITFRNTPSFLSRYGGDEFVVVTYGSGETMADEILQRIRNQFQMFNEKSNLPYKLSISLGYSIMNEKGEKTIPYLLKEADSMMYQEKSKYHRGEHV